MLLDEKNAGDVAKARPDLLWREDLRDAGAARPEQRDQAFRGVGCSTDQGVRHPAAARNRGLDHERAHPTHHVHRPLSPGRARGEKGRIQCGSRRDLERAVHAVRQPDGQGEPESVAVKGFGQCDRQAARHDRPVEKEHPVDGRPLLLPMRSNSLKSNWHMLRNGG